MRQLLFLPGQRAFLTASSDGTVRRWPLASPVTPSQRWPGTKTLLEKWHPVASPDGMSIACLDADRLTQLWRRADNSRVTFPSGHEPLAALDDGRVLTRIGDTGEVVMWQTQVGDASAVEIWRASGVPSHPFYTAVIHSVLSRDGRRVAALLPGKLLVVDLDQRVARGTGNQRMIFGTVPGQTLDLSPDGQTIAVTGFLGHRVRLYRADDPAAGHVILTPASATAGSDSACAFSRDGRRLFVGNDDSWVRVFDPATRQELTGESWHAHTTAVTALAVSQQGADIVTAARGTLILWPSASDDEPRRDTLNFVVASTPAWVQWAGQDRTLLHAAPKQPLEAWETARE